MNCRHDTGVCRGGSYCYNGYCICPEGYEERNEECDVPKIYGNKIVILLNNFLVDPGQSCDRSINSIAQIECTGNSVCANGYCVCPNGEPILNNMCVTVNSIGN